MNFLAYYYLLQDFPEEGAKWENPNNPKHKPKNADVDFLSFIPLSSFLHIHVH